jgi:hypothetical protein
MAAQLRAAMLILRARVAGVFALGKGGANAAEPQGAAERGAKGFEGLAARGRGGQRFGQFIKCRWVHFRSLLSQ